MGMEEPETFSTLSDIMTLYARAKRQGALKKLKNCIVEKVVLEKITDGGESLANLFISLNEMGSVMSSLIFKELVSILVLFNY